MARKKEESVFEILSTVPWWISPIFASVVFVFLKWVLPALAGQNIFLKVIAQGVQSNAGLLALLFLIPAPFAYLYALRRQKLFDDQTGLESIRSMSWQEFELLVGESFRRQGYSVEEIGGSAPDGGIDLVLRKNGKKKIVQCKHWKSRQVGVSPVRELYGVMVAERADEAVFVTIGTYSSDALQFAQSKPMRLIAGEELLNLIAVAQEGSRISGAKSNVAAKPSPQPILAIVCPTCGSAMVKRVARKGAKAGESFWGCTRYPACKGTRPA